MGWAGWGAEHELRFPDPTLRTEIVINPASLTTPPIENASFQVENEEGIDDARNAAELELTVSLRAERSECEAVSSQWEIASSQQTLPAMTLALLAIV